jgi:phenylacetate-coenzyme A ligase PaaK-like adenylate-forming protein
LIIFIAMPPTFTAEYHRLSAAALDAALEGVSAYRSWRGRDPGPRFPPDERYAALPTLTKADLRSHGWRAFVPAGADPDAALRSGEIELVETSGTTSERVVNVWHQKWWDASERLSWAYHARTASLGLGAHREAILTSPRNTGRLSDGRLLSSAERTLGRFLYLNERSTTVRWSAGLLDRMLDELERFAPAVLEANPNYLARLSLHAWKRRRRPYQPPVVILTYENPAPLSRRLIRLSFESPLVSSYGSTEAGYVFMECERGVLHQNTGSCRLDFEPLKEEHGGPDLGRIFITAFGHPYRALVRFDVGDLVRLRREPCPCGRNHGYAAAAVAGRTASLTFTTDGRAVATDRVEEALLDVPGLAAYAVEQKCHTAYEAAVETYGRAQRAKIAAFVRDRLIALYGNDANVRVTPVRRVPAGPSGKYRSTRTLFPFDENSLFRREAGE